MIVLGADLGTKYTGLGAIQIIDGRPSAHWCCLVKTETDAAMVRQGQRAEDDQDRLHKIVDTLAYAIQGLKPQLITYEEYTTYDDHDVNALKTHLRTAFKRGEDYGYLERSDGSRRTIAQNSLELASQDLQKCRDILAKGNGFVGTRGRGRATRTLSVVGTVITLDRCYQIEAVPHYAGQLKRRFPGKGKEATIAAVKAMLPNTQECVQHATISRYEQDHVYDAWGHAILAAENRGLLR